MITRDELLKMIDDAVLPAEKQILLNHLHQFDAEPIECSACSLEEPDGEVVDETDEE